MVWRIWHQLIRIVSGEWFIGERPNGGTMVAARATWTAAIGFAGGLIAHEVLRPDARMAFDGGVAKQLVQARLGVFAALWGAAYAAFYTRFSSQWAYLAGVYNQIKAAEVRLCSEAAGKDQPQNPAMAEWKAGFLEDVEDLHVALKPMYCSLVLKWGDDKAVRAAYDDTVAGGVVRLDRLKVRAQAAQRRQSAEHGAPAEPSRVM